MRALSAVLLLVVLSACGGSPATPGVPSASDAPPTGSPGSALIELEDRDLCALLDEATVQGITGESVRFVTDGRSERNQASCFWGAAVPNVPAYVEVSAFRTRDGLASHTFPAGCTASTVTGLDVEARGATCPADPQRKVWLAVSDLGIIVTVVVNEPARALEPGDLAEAAEAVWLGLQ